MTEPKPRRRRSAVRLFLWLGAIGLLLMVATGVAVALLLGGGSDMLAKQEAGWLHLRLTPMISDSPGNEGLFVDPMDMPPLTSELTAALRNAALDPDVEGLFLEVGATSLGWAQTQELRDAILAFRERGDKECVAWAGSYSNKEYYLASACDEVLLAPAGMVLVNGLSVTQMYYAEAFEKYGISANFEHVGDFKSAVEPYQRTSPSEAASEAMNTLLDSLYDQLVGGIAEGRGLDFEEARQLVDDPPMTPESALDRGLVDGLTYRDELTDDRFDGAITMTNYLRDQRQDWKRGKVSIAVIHAEGAIIDGESGGDLFGGAYIGDRTLRRQLRKVREDDKVKAVVLRVNSPGGSGSASDAIWREVGLTAKEKPVVVSMGDYAASGGYYISMGADWIMAEPGTLTGSIGVFGGKINPAGALEKLGVSLHSYERGEHASIFSTTEDFNEADREKFRTFLAGFYDIFLEKAAEGREMSVDEVHQVAQGRVWTGEQALEHKLIDELGSIDDAIEKARELGAITERAKVVHYPERKSFLDALFAEMTPTEEAAMGPMSAVPGATRALGELQQLMRVLDDGGVAALSPVRID